MSLLKGVTLTERLDLESVVQTILSNGYRDDPPDHLVVHAGDRTLGLRRLRRLYMEGGRDGAYMFCADLSAMTSDDQMIICRKVIVRVSPGGSHTTVHLPPKNCRQRQWKDFFGEE